MKPRNRRLHLLFRIGVALKGLDGFLECAAGAALLFTNRAGLLRFADRLTAGELRDDPRDFVAGRVLRFLRRMAWGGKFLVAAYLLGHGAVKLGLAAGLWRGKLGAYPAALAILGLLLGYQLYRLSLRPSLGLALVDGFDLAIIGLIAWDYRYARREGRR